MVISGLSGSACAQVQLLADLSHPPLNEISGIAASRSYADVYWVHNDSGDSARIFAIDAAGQPIVPHFWQPPTANSVWPGIPILDAHNIDWEAIAVANNQIYVADIGNNGNARRDLGVYIINEPNPRAISETRSLSYVPVRYPDQDQWPASQWHFDCEAMFVDAGVLYFITKHRKAGEISGWAPGARLYRLVQPSPLQENQLQFITERSDLFLVTDASLSPNGTTLAVLTYQHVHLFPRPQQDDNWFATKPRTFSLPFLETGQVEAITWRDDTTLFIASEGRRLFRLDVSNEIFKP